MRQSKRQVTGKAVIMAMLDQMDTIYLGIQDEPWPYVVPLNFGYSWEEELVFFFHCAREGHKLLPSSFPMRREASGGICMTTVR